MPRIIPAPQIINSNLIRYVHATDDGQDVITEISDKLKISKWDDEVNFSLGLDIPELGNISELSKSISDKTTGFVGIKHELQIYPKDQDENGAMEFEIILKEKPKTNKITFQVNSKGLKFYYQPELTQEEKDQGINRPDNVIGSYAVYHENKRNDYSKIGGKNYKTGKVCHIYRPKVTDNKGISIWTDLKFDELSSTLTILIDKKFLDEAIYPVSIDPDFGYTTKGTTQRLACGNYVNGLLATGVAGTGISISACIQNEGSQSVLYKYALYKHSDSTLVTNGITDEGTLDASATKDWRTLNFTVTPTLETIDYVICIWGQLKSPPYAEPSIWYDSGGSDTYHLDYTDTTYGPTWKSTATFSYTDNNIPSIYCTYSPSYTTYPISIASSSTIIMSISNISIRPIILSNSLTSSSSLSEIYKAIRAIASTTTKASSIIRLAILTRPISNTLTETDTISRLILNVRVLSSTITESSSLNRLSIFNRGITETLTSGSAIVRILLTIRSLSSALNLIDAINRTGSVFIRDMSGTSTLTGEVDLIKGAFISITNSLTSSSSIIRNLTAIRDLSATHTLTDSLIRILYVPRDISESYTLSSSIFSGFIKTIGLSEGLNLSDIFVSRLFTGERNLTEITNLGDSLDKRITILRELAGSIKLTGELAFGYLHIIVINNTLTVNSVINRYATEQMKKVGLEMATLMDNVKNRNINIYKFGDYL